MKTILKTRLSMSMWALPVPPRNITRPFATFIRGPRRKKKRRPIESDQRPPSWFTKIAMRPTMPWVLAIIDVVRARSPVSSRSSTGSVWRLEMCCSTLRKEEVQIMFTTRRRFRSAMASAAPGSSDIGSNWIAPQVGVRPLSVSLPCPGATLGRSLPPPVRWEVFQ